jgi:hypothetical protein
VNLHNDAGLGRVPWRENDGTGQQQADQGHGQHYGNLTGCRLHKLTMPV